MERETLLTMLLMIFGGCALQLLALWPGTLPTVPDAHSIERAAWLRVCLPALPMLLIAAWLAGWAMTQPDPVRVPLDPAVVVALWLPFGLLFLRALARAVWALLREPPDCGVSTVGLMAPQIVFSPFLARQLDEPVILAALAHERAHGRHRDPLRIWVAQCITDLQWPWPQAQRRLERWLEALEWARDEEARHRGVAGSDLAAAVLSSVRFVDALTPHQRATLAGTQLAHARLVGDGHTLRRRVFRLLAPLPGISHVEPRRVLGIRASTASWIPLLLAVMVLGLTFGGTVMRSLLALTT